MGRARWHFLAFTGGKSSEKTQKSAASARPPSPRPPMESQKHEISWRFLIPLGGRGNWWSRNTAGALRELSQNSPRALPELSQSSPRTLPGLSQGSPRALPARPCKSCGVARPPGSEKNVVKFSGYSACFSLYFKGSMGFDTFREPPKNLRAPSSESGAQAAPAGSRGTPRELSQSSPRTPRELSQKSPRILPELSQSSPRTLPEFSQNSPRALRELSQKSPRTLRELPESSPRALPEVSQKSRRSPPEVSENPARAFREFSESSPRSLPELSEGFPRALGSVLLGLSRGFSARG